MSDRSVVHSTFVLERTYPAEPARVFAAWASREAKSQWFGSPGDNNGNYELDFRVGGRESWRGGQGGPTGKSTFSFDAIYQDIVEDERIVYAYDMHMDDQRISVSLTTIELEAVDGGTRLTMTEQGAFLDGLDQPDRREGGSGTLLDQLGEVLARATANT
ncbi:MAG TPA: SRPBCC family protein [Thermoleophilaceae bacterium]